MQEEESSLLRRRGITLAASLDTSSEALKEEKVILPTDRPQQVKSDKAALKAKQGVHSKFAAKATALQKHVSFWDRKKNGVFYPWDTYDGCRSLGFNSVFSVAYALAFHILHASCWTSEFWIPNLLFPVYVERIHRAKHGSDTGTYTIDGNFKADSFNKIFRRHDKNKKGGLSYSELINMMITNRCAGDVLGWYFQFFLWSGLWLLAADERGVLSRQDILSHYDGTLSYEIEKRRKAGEKLPIWRFGTAFTWSQQKQNTSQKIDKSRDN